MYINIYFCNSFKSTLIYLGLWFNVARLEITISILENKMKGSNYVNSSVKEFLAKWFLIITKLEFLAKIILTVSINVKFMLI